MPRKRATSNASSADGARDQELGTMYDYLAKVILLGPSGTGKSCLLHRFVKDEWRVLCAQTIGVEFASKVVKVGSGSRRKRIKLQLWDTAGTERFRAVSRSYYRGAAGAILVYDISSHASFRALPTFLHDARALASPNLTVILAGNKVDIANESEMEVEPSLSNPSATVSMHASSFDSRRSGLSPSHASYASSFRDPSGFGMRTTATVAEGREVLAQEASQWASKQKIPISVEVSALSGDFVTEIFERLATMILTKIELGEIDPSDPQSGIQYGDMTDTASVRSGLTVEDGHSTLRQRRGIHGPQGWSTGLRDWEDVFHPDGRGRNRCC